MSEKKYNLSLAPAYKVKNGYWSMEIDAKSYDAIQQIRLGGKLVIKEIPAESRKKETSPQAYFEYISPEEVKEFKKNRPAPKTDKVVIKPNDSDLDI